jgi:hypothetical protein
MHPVSPTGIWNSPGELGPGRMMQKRDEVMGRARILIEDSGFQAGGERRALACQEVIQILP